jgi:hypothetical protein
MPLLRAHRDEHRHRFFTNVPIEDIAARSSSDVIDGGTRPAPHAGPYCQEIES